MNESIKKCCICNGEKTGEFIVINDKKYHLNCIEQLQQEKQQLKEKLEMQKDSNKLLCKSIMCDDCNCSVCETHKQQIRLEQQLKQRDEVIDEAIDDINKMINIGYFDEEHLTQYMPTQEHSEFGCRALIIKEILQKYKGDNNE